MRQADDRSDITDRRQPGSRIVRAEDADAWGDGAAFLVAAKSAADRLRTDSVEAYERERRRGFEEGWRAGAEEAARLVVETKAKVAAYLDSIESELVQLAFDAIRQVLGSFDPGDLLAQAVRHALAKLRQDQTIVLQVSPPLVEEMRVRLAGELTGGARRLVAIEADPQLPHHACVLASEFGFIDVGIEAQLEMLRQALAPNGSA